MKKIFILGISSFSGASIASYLHKKNYKIYGSYSIDRYINRFIYNKKKIKTYKVDLLKDTKKLINLLKKIKPSVILDHASICMVEESWKYPKKYYEINVKSRFDIIDGLSNKKFLKKYIYISTPEIFGSSKDKIKEKFNIFNPSTPYAASKLSAEINFKHAFNSNKFPLIISRFSNFYGPGQPIHRLIPKVLISLRKKVHFPLHGDGSSKRNFIFTDDFCEGINKVIIKGKPGDVYHFSGDKYISIKEIIKIICRLKKVKFNNFVKTTQDRTGKDSIYKLSSGFTKKKLSWKCKTNMEKGIKKTLRFYDENYKDLSNQPMNYKL